MLLIYSVCTLFGAFAPNAWALIVWRGLAGVGIGAELVVIDTYVTEMLPSKARGRYVAITQLVGFTAIPVVALLSKLLVPTHWLLEGWRWVMVIGGVGGLFAWYIRRRCRIPSGVSRDGTRSGSDHAGWNAKGGRRTGHWTSRSRSRWHRRSTCHP
jgi:MFS family permease